MINAIKTETLETGEVKAEDDNEMTKIQYALRHRLASLSVAMSELFLTYIVLFLKYIKLFLKYLKLFLKHTAKTAKSMS